MLAEYKDKIPGVDLETEFRARFVKEGERAAMQWAESLGAIPSDADVATAREDAMRAAYRSLKDTNPFEAAKFAAANPAARSQPATAPADHGNPFEAARARLADPNMYAAMKQETDK